jgi:hypothetical protein
LQSISASIEGSLPENTARWQARANHEGEQSRLLSHTATPEAFRRARERKADGFFGTGIAY